MLGQSSACFSVHVSLRTRGMAPHKRLSKPADFMKVEKEPSKLTQNTEQIYDRYHKMISDFSERGAIVKLKQPFASHKHGTNIIVMSCA